jgi:hypothetical protein
MATDKEVIKREMLLVKLVGARLNQIAKTHPNAKVSVESLHSEIIALTIDWD